MSGPNLPAIYIANAAGIMLMVGVLTGSTWKKQKSRESQSILAICITLIIACIADPICFYADGRDGAIYGFLVFSMNTILYATNLVLGAFWICMVDRHINGRVTAVVNVLLLSLSGAGAIGLIANCFTPLVFYVDSSNVYHRSFVYWCYSAIGYGYFMIALIIYIVGLVRGGRFKYFPILQVFVPAVIGAVAQSIVYGISVIWPACAVGVTLMIISLQNENIHIDKLTGMYNRYYMDYIQKKRRSKKGFCMILVDMDDFKKINEKYGRSEGDEALLAVADILRTVVGARGTVIRYAGDEFLMLVNTTDPNEVNTKVTMTEYGINRFNEESSKPYKLSASISQGIFNLKDRTMAEAFEMVDAGMYESKKKYYRDHERRKS